jgi:hypothetical protein
VKPCSGNTFDNLHANTTADTVAADGVVVAAVHPGHGDTRMRDGKTVQDLPAGGRVLDRRGGDDHGEQKAEYVGGNVPLASPLIFLFASVP